MRLLEHFVSAGRWPLLGSLTVVFFQEWGVSKLTFEEDPEPIWKARDNAVKNLCADKKVECIERVSHNLWDPKE